jgi:uncharacterized protein YecE (DUF72 family)
MPWRVLIGTSGWHYDSWRGPFYPKGLPIKSQLQYYASQFSTVELNGVFYRTPTPEAVRSWYEQTGNDFVFAWKASKFITHWKRLSQNSVNSLELLDARRKGWTDPVSVAARLSGRLGPVGFVLQAAVQQAALQFRISASELVCAADFKVVVRTQHRALPVGPSRSPGTLDAHRGFRLCPGARPDRSLPRTLSPGDPGTMGQAHQVLEQAGLRRIRLFR